MSTAQPLSIVITGSTRGVGRALAEGFLSQGDRVTVSSRSATSVSETVDALQRAMPAGEVGGFAADVREADSVNALVADGAERQGGVDVLICNAGVVGVRGALADVPAESVDAVVRTNLLGPLLCAQAAARQAAAQARPLHVFLMDGSGSRGNSTARYAAYGATKRAIPQLVDSLSIEARDGWLRVHALSPGMVLTDLLLKGSPEPMARTVFNFLAEEPETVAEELVPRIRDVVRADKRKTYIQFLTPGRAVYRLATGFLLGFRRNLFFDQSTGRRIEQAGSRYNENGVRMRD